MKIVRILVVPVLLLFIYGAAIYFSPLPYEIIDQNKSNIVSVVELIDAYDIGKRAQAGSHSGCYEYYWLKDGLPAYETCQI